MWTAFLIFVGGGLGSVARWLVALVFERHVDSASAFPWATLLVNVTGSIAIGVLASLAGSNVPARAFFMVGICGGYTTFSSFSLQVLLLIQEGAWPRALAYLAASVLLCLAGVWLGHALALGIQPARTA